MNTKCGCFYCSNRAEFYKGKANGRGFDLPSVNHMEIFRRLAAVKIMHGTPGQPKGKSKG